MRVSLNWLNDYVDTSGIDPHELGEKLSLTGTKLETIERPGAEIEGIVVAEVLAIEAHPNADNLSMVEVSVGGETERVVCGAKNFAVGDRVPFARVGSRLPGMAITARKIRGEVSKGMLCSGKELGISKDSAGLLILQPDAPLGDDVVKLLGLDDTILEFEITPNRPDCLSIIGIAREVGALWGRPLTKPDTEDATHEIDAPVSVSIEDPHGCPRYLARYIEGVTVGPSPNWMAARLLSAGVRPISNIVDATNYVLMEMGQPLHAFDAATITDGAIVVRKASNGETLTTLDGIERSLHPEDLVIADPTRAIALAGVMGGEDTEVSEATADVILECANFDKVAIAYTSRRHSLRTEASARFEKGADVEGVERAAARCAQLMADCAGGKVAAATIDTYPTKPERETITLRAARTNKLLGIEITPERQRELLESIEVPARVDGDRIEVEVPTWRPDLNREADLIEEVARLEGYDKLRSTVPSGPAGILTAEQRAVRRITRALAATGMTEAWTSSFLAPADLDALDLDADHPARRLVSVSNPMVEHEGALRSTMLPGLLRSLARNRAHHAPGVGLFEIGRIYEPTTGDLAHEELVFGAAMGGDRVGQNWRGAAEPWDFFSAKGALEAALRVLGIEGLTYGTIAGHNAPFHPTRGATVHLGTETIGALGEIHPDICEAWDIWQGSVVFEVGLAPVFAALPDKVQTTDLARFPSLHMDIAVIVDDGVAAARVEDLIERAGAPEVVNVRMFDLYRGEQVGDGKKSLAYSLELRVPDRTLTDEEGSQVMDRIVNALAERVGAKLRG